MPEVSHLIEAAASTVPPSRLAPQAGAAQQPDWSGHPDLACIRAELADLPTLVSADEIHSLRTALAAVEAGGASVLQVGECAELFDMAESCHVRQRVLLYRRLAAHLAARTGKDVVLIARMAGQHAKPRSEAIELLPDGRTLPVYRGDAVNTLAPSLTGRRSDPWRMLTSYDCSSRTVGQLGNTPHGQPVYVSHEALLMDYEEPLTRGRPHRYAGSGHFVWIGERTRNVAGWHVGWAAQIANPVGVKLSGRASVEEVQQLLRMLNPAHEHGRLSFIVRAGARSATAALGRWLASAAVPVIWQCDPMHGNTRKVEGVKVRLMSDLRDEITAFVRALRAANQHPAGLHLEVTPLPVRECFERADDQGMRNSIPPCDPRLNPAQALALIDHFADELAR